MCYSQFFDYITNIRYFIFNSGVVLGILNLTLFILTLRTVLLVVAKLVMLGISFLTAFTLALRVVLIGELVISGIFLQYFLP